MNSIFFQKVIWAVDALEENVDHLHAQYLIGALTRATRTQVEPLFILHAPEKSFATYRALAEKNLSAIVSTCDIAEMQAGTIVGVGSSSIRTQVESLLRYVEENEADAIIVATHARKGLARFFLGSFAETLVLSATVPVFTVNPDTVVRERISNILFPTTFESKFKPAFERVVEMAKILEANVTLYHKFLPIPALQVTLDSMRELEQNSAFVKSHAHNWQEHARHLGVETEIHLDDQAGSLRASIEHYGTVKNFDLIAMVTETKAGVNLLMGSTTRQIIRQSTCPVWVMKIETT